MGDHARNTPSAAKRWMACPGSINATGGEGSPSTVYSREGDFGALIGKRVLLEDIDTVSSLIGTKSADGEFTLDQDLADAIQVHVNVCREILMLGGAHPRIEERVTITSDVYGTPDFSAWGHDMETLEVVDLKLGRGVYVDHVENPQLQIYALGEIARMGRDPRMLKKIDCTVVQPRYATADAVRTWSCTGEELHAFKLRMLACVEATKQPNAPLVAGDHCKFCPVAPTCPALRDQMLAVAIDLFPTGDVLKVNRAPDMSMLPAMPVAELAKVLNNLDIVESWVEMIRESAFKRAVAGEKIPGWRLKDKIGNRRWLSKEVAAAMLRHHGIEPMEPAEVISPAEAERKSRGLKSLIAKMVTRPVTGVALVRGDGPDLTSSPVDDLPMLPQT